jgi:hypothetical protein
MTYEHSIEFEENDVLTVVIQGVDGSYFMWQRGLTEDVGASDGVYFEVDTQNRGGHEVVKECSLDEDGIHVVLRNGELEHFYFPPKFDKHHELQTGLLKIYQGKENVLEIHDIN